MGLMERHKLAATIGESERTGQGNPESNFGFPTYHEFKSVFFFEGKPLGLKT
jgi:hypothetical protein